MSSKYFYGQRLRTSAVAFFLTFELDHFTVWDTHNGHFSHSPLDRTKSTTHNNAAHHAPSHTHPTRCRVVLVHQHAALRAIRAQQATTGSAPHLARHVSVTDSCQALTRLRPHELKKLCRDLLINPRAGITGNWRFCPLHRAAVALGSLASPITSRRARQAFGWAANSVGANMESFVQCVLDHLDADGSRQQLLITHARLAPSDALLPAHHRSLSVLLLCVCLQRVPFVGGLSQSSKRGEQRRRGRQSSRTASALWTRRTSSCSVQRIPCWSAAPTARTRSNMRSSSSLSSTGRVSTTSGDEQLRWRRTSITLAHPRLLCPRSVACSLVL